MKKIIQKLYLNGIISRDEIITIYEKIAGEDLDRLMEAAYRRKFQNYGNKIFIRGLVEISSYCRRDCKYCGINRYNTRAERFRLSREEILEACARGYDLGFRTFVLQGGEDDYFTDDLVVSIIEELKGTYDDIALTLSLGEKAYESYERFYRAGADRYLLRHETINEELFKRIHRSSSYRRRIDSLFELKGLGFQEGAGFMVGIPGQTYANLADDLLFLKKLQPAMVGLGPFLSHKDTVYGHEPNGSLRDSLISLALVRLLLPDILLPATTALSTLDPRGRELGFRAGANVIMPNLSPRDKVDKYSLYDNKLNTGIESAGQIDRIRQDVEAMGYEIFVGRGDNIRRLEDDKRGKN